MKRSRRWMLDLGDLTEMPNPNYEIQEKEIERLMLLGVDATEQILPKLKLLHPSTQGMSPGECITLAFGILIDEGKFILREEEKDGNL